MPIVFARAVLCLPLNIPDNACFRSLGMERIEMHTRMMESMVEHATAARPSSTLDSDGEVTKNTRSVWRWTKRLGILDSGSSSVEVKATRDQLEMLGQAIRGLRSVESVE